MVESTSKISGGTKRIHDKIAEIVSSGATLSATEMDLRALSQQVCKMPDRGTRDCCDATLDVVFEAAS